MPALNAVSRQHCKIRVIRWAKFGPRRDDWEELPDITAHELADNEIARMRRRYGID